MPDPLIAFIVVLVACLGTAGFWSYASRRALRERFPKQEALPPGSIEGAALQAVIDHVPPPQPRVPTWNERLAKVGIRRAFLWEAMGGYLWEIGRDTNVYAEHARPEMIGWLFVISDDAAKAHAASMTDFDRRNRPEQAMGAAHFACKEHGSDHDVLYEIAKAGVKDGVLADGRPELRFLGAFCCRCGVIDDRSRADSQVLGALWKEHANMRRLVESLESDEDRIAIAQAKLASVDQEIEALDSRRNLLMAERARLHADLGHGAPFRGLSPAKLDDPPDDRAKEMPALI